MGNAIAANGDANWRVLNFHHVLYGQGAYTLTDGVGLRARYAPVIEKYGIDVVFNGHDHAYSRSSPIGGTVYVTLNSASGSKYYALSPKQPYTEAMNQAKRPNFSVAEITGNFFACATYQVNADDSVTEIDEFTIIKPAAVPLGFAATGDVGDGDAGDVPAGADSGLVQRRRLLFHRAYLMEHSRFRWVAAVQGLQGWQYFPYNVTIAKLMIS